MSWWWLGCFARDNPPSEGEKKPVQREKSSREESLGRLVAGCCVSRHDALRRKREKRKMWHAARSASIDIAPSPTSDFPSAPSPEHDVEEDQDPALWDILVGGEPEFDDDNRSEGGESDRTFFDANSDFPLTEMIPEPPGEVEDPWSEPIPERIIASIKENLGEDVDIDAKVAELTQMVNDKFEGEMSAFQKRHFTKGSLARAYSGQRCQLDVACGVVLEALCYFGQMETLLTSRKLEYKWAPCDFRIAGVDAHGHPILYGCAGNQTRPMHELCDHFIMVFHAAIEYCFGKGDQVVMIWDFAGFSWSHVSSCSIAEMQAFGRRLSACFPERMSKVICVDVPMIANILYEAAKPMISERTKQRIAFPIMDDMQDLLMEFCEEESVGPLLQAMRQNRTSMSVDARRPGWTCWGRGTPCAVYDLDRKFIGVPDFDEDAE
mmetsp:Transcript_74207/g.197900  ORF Transcript_74207/g.197900 Transcript_74207/m.197900 type:complete len:436 (-) Transcript_74207:95-1402(-)